MIKRRNAVPVYLGKFFGFMVMSALNRSCNTELLLNCGIMPITSEAAVTMIQKIGLCKKSIATQLNTVIVIGPDVTGLSVVSSADMSQ